jgi:MoxR-like ATPase
MSSKLRTLSDELNENFKERDDVIAGSLLALISGEHVLFIGPPGTAKSMLAREMCKCIDGGNFFYYLLTRFTTPDEIFGPLSLSSLQEDIFSRKTDGYLPTANVSFLDEIFKANSSILNSLLTILNERRYHNGSEILDVPLISVFGASNELPEENESLEALYDRFLFRYYVGYVQDETNFVDLILGHAEDFVPSVRLNIDELNAAHNGASKIELDTDVLDAIVALRKEFKTTGVTISDRRWKKMILVLRVAAHALERERVDKTMLPLLQHMTWNRPEEKLTIRKLLIDMAVSGGINLDKTDKDIKDLHASAVLIKDFVLPEVVTCHSCGDVKFTKWKELAHHASNHPDHAYTLPGSEELYQLKRYKVAPKLLPNLMAKYEAEGHPVVLTMPGKDRELYQGEVADFEEELGSLEVDLEKERIEMIGTLGSNFWLTRKDREDILACYDAKIRTMAGMKAMVAETKALITSEDKVEN